MHSSQVTATPPQSCLVVPGDRRSMHEKALESPAHEVVFDLEDAVAETEKAAARTEVIRTLSREEWSTRRVAVRINPPESEHHRHDLVLLARIAHDGFSVVVPKVEKPTDLHIARDLLGEHVSLQVVIETAQGLLNAKAIAEESGVEALILGYADLAASLGRRQRTDDPESWRVQQELIVASARAAGVRAIDGPCFKLRDRRGLARAARLARTIGFDGKWAIHPDQVEVINEIFAVTAAEREWAQRVLTALEEAGGGPAAVGNAMVDEAMARTARRLLQLPKARQTRTDSSEPELVAAPYFDDLEIGDSFESPAVTITSGHAALHQALVGDRLRLALDAELTRAVTGVKGPLAHPMLVCDIAIGQSTIVTGRVLGNLFYRGLVCRPVVIGTTLRTRTVVEAKRPASRNRGIAVLHITTVDESGEPVLDFFRAPLLPAREAAETPDHCDLDAFGSLVDFRAAVPSTWSLAPLREARLGPLFEDLVVGTSYAIEAGDTITSAPELARLTLNLAATHTDASFGMYGERLVYGGHVIGVAAAHLTRALPDLATILAWHSCDHLGPAFEGDVLRSRVEIMELESLADGGLVHARVFVTAQGAADEHPRDVLDWKLVGLMP
ncbi:MAG: aldolase/citrate lyase family protein [Thermomicrobium sp.]|nr:aldolase/citrate lyase family protein [Thermomicrobium sp.]